MHLGNLRNLIGEVQRVLRPSAVFLGEIPNSLNVVVSSSTFWIDPTHIRPLHPEVLRYLLLECGFEHTELRFINPADSWFRRTSNRHLNQILHSFFGP